MRATLYFMPLLLASATPAATYDPEAVAWSRLELEATKFFLTARSAVELAGRPSREAVAELLVPTQGHGLAPRGTESFRVDLHTRILNRDSRVRFWFDPGDARALQRSSYDRSKKRSRHRTYRYTRDGVFRRTLNPADGEVDRPYASWSRVDEHFVPLPAAGSAVTEAAALLYLIPAGDFRAPGDRQRVRVFTRGKVREVDVAAAGKERIRVSYAEVSDAGERRVEGEVEALRVAVRPLAAAGEDKDDFKLLGLEGDIDIFLEPRTRALLLVRGKVDLAGTVHLRLKRAMMR